jgi:hypothetical protein
MLAFEIIWGWIILSCTAGPLFAWAFFFPVRREDEIRRHGRSKTLYKGPFHLLQVS